MDDESFELGGVEFVCRVLKGRFPSTPQRMLLVKSRRQVEWYEQFLRDLEPQTMIEVGTFDGASLAFCAELVNPRRLVGVDLREEPSAALRAFIERRQLEDRVRPYYGVDQTDATRLREIVDAEFGDEPLDLVVDDGSHLLDASRVTFDCLFPRLKPGGIYVVEDWPMHRMPHIERPQTTLILELVLACSMASEAIENVEVNWNYVMVTRGHADLEVGTFALADCLGPRARALLVEGGQAPTAW